MKAGRADGDLPDAVSEGMAWTVCQRYSAIDAFGLCIRS